VVAGEGRISRPEEARRDPAFPKLRQAHLVEAFLPERLAKRLSRLRAQERALRVCHA
jgi:hypothetical protein